MDPLVLIKDFDIRANLQNLSDIVKDIIRLHQLIHLQSLQVNYSHHGVVRLTVPMVVVAWLFAMDLVQLTLRRIVEEEDPLVPVFLFLSAMFLPAPSVVVCCVVDVLTLVEEVVRDLLVASLILFDLRIRHLKLVSAPPLYV